MVVGDLSISFCCSLHWPKITRKIIWICFFPCTILFSKLFIHLLYYYLLFLFFYLFLGYLHMIIKAWRSYFGISNLLFLYLYCRGITNLILYITRLFRAGIYLFYTYIINRYKHIRDNWLNKHTASFHVRV